MLFDWQLWQEKGKIKLYGKYPLEKIHQLPPTQRPHTLYRGWMMKPEDYTRFFFALYGQSIYLLTETDEYEVMHEFPRVYPLIQADTPRILTFPIGTPVDLSAVKREFPRFIVKDYVKSVKGSRFPASFYSSITQDAFEQQMKLFYQYRGDQLTGGICIKEYVDLKRYDGHTNEWRVFYYYFQPATCTPNSGQPDNAPAPPESLIQKYRIFKSCFYTIDFAEKADGSWTILETGDGQVSGLPEKLNPNDFYPALTAAFKKEHNPDNTRQDKEKTALFFKDFDCKGILT